MHQTDARARASRDEPHPAWARIASGPRSRRAARALGTVASGRSPPPPGAPECSVPPSCHPARRRRVHYRHRPPPTAPARPRCARRGPADRHPADRPPAVVPAPRPAAQRSATAASPGDGRSPPTASSTPPAPSARRAHFVCTADRLHEQCTGTIAGPTGKPQHADNVAVAAAAAPLSRRSSGTATAPTTCVASTSPSTSPLIDPSNRRRRRHTRSPPATRAPLRPGPPRQRQHAARVGMDDKAAVGWDGAFA
jgi:hypothetical protein